MIRDLNKSAIAGSIVNDNRNESKYLSDYIVSFPSDDDNIYLNSKLLSKHLLLIGAIGTGKTNVIHKVMKDINNLNHDSFAMIFDTKGDFYRYYNKEKDILIATGKNYRSITNFYNVFIYIGNINIR